MIDAALDAVSAPRPGADGTPDPRNPGQRRAEGLLELIRLAMGAPEMPEDGGEPVTVVVTVPLETLMADLLADGVVAGELENGAPISAETARRLACDAFIVAAVLGTNSEVLDIGRLSRAVPRPMRRALVATRPRMRVSRLRTATALVPGPSHRALDPRPRADLPVQPRAALRATSSSHPP